MLDEKSVLEMMKGVNDSYNALMPLNAIWLEKPLQTYAGRTVRLTADDLVKVDNGKLVDCNDTPNCKVLELHGNISNTIFKIKVQSLSNNEVSTIEL